jgi:hypothetical protein
MKTKQCTKCNEVKSVDLFPSCIGRFNKPYIRNVCKSCKAKSYKEWKHSSIEVRQQIRENEKKYRRSKKSKIAANNLQKKQWAELRDYPIIRCLLQSEKELSIKDITPELIELKRKQLKLYRLCQELKRK